MDEKQIVISQSRLSLRNAIAFGLSLCLVAGCSERSPENSAEHSTTPEEPESFTVAYLKPGGSGFSEDAYDTCRVAGPNTSVVIAEIMTEYSVRHGYENCPEEEPEFRAGYVEMEVDVLHQASGPSVSGQFDTIWFGHYLPSVEDAGIGKGTTVLLALRETTDGYAVVTNFLEARINGEVPEDQAGQIASELPTDWSDLVTEARSVTADFSQCPLPKSDGYEIKRMTQAEFDEWFRTPVDTCDALDYEHQEEDTGEQVGDTVNDRD